MNTLQDISKINWLERWAGSYTFISCAYWGEQYFHALKRELGVQFDHTLFIHKKGTVSFFIPQEEYEHFGKTLAKRVHDEPDLAEQWLTELKNNADRISAVMKKLHGTIPTMSEYKEFLSYYDRHLPFHNFMKKTVDFLSADDSHLMPLFKDARVYSEHVYSDTEKFFRSVMQAIAEKEGRNADLLTCLDRKEFEAYLANGTLPDEPLLNSRFQKSILYFENGESHILLGEDVDSLEKKLFQSSSDASELKGTSAFPGRVEGTARVITDPHNPGPFEQGDILVTGMTRPEFMPLIKKASAIVTDVGGVLCHAAITARELKIPCVVGTRSATKTFKNGDVLKIDAENGTVMKVNS